METMPSGERVPVLLQKAAGAVCSFLENILPPLSERWWDLQVLPHLSFQQRRAVESKRVTGLSGLDLAALLRVLDLNWYEISERVGFSNEDRHFLKELRTVRDRWAHSSVAEFASEDVYRDLDTLQRFLIAIGADDDLLAEVKQTRDAAFPIAGKALTPTVAQSAASSSAFQVGQLVSPKADSNCVAAVTGVQPGVPETRYDVFEAGVIKTYYESQLRLAHPSSSLEPIPLADFDAYLSALH